MLVVHPAWTVVGYNGAMFEPGTGVAPRFVPDWPTCGHGDGNCPGRRTDGFEHCLAHLAPDDLDTYIHSITPGADLDLRGTALPTDLLGRLLARMVLDAGPDSPAEIGHANFQHCHFLAGSTSGPEGEDGDSVWSQNEWIRQTASFEHVQFRGEARFDRARFSGLASFSDARFSGFTVFDRAEFNRFVKFTGAQFSNVQFTGARFRKMARFDDAQFSRSALLSQVTFGGPVWFDRAKVGGIAQFGDAQFESTTRFGPLVADHVHLAAASFAKHVVIEVEAGALTADDARFDQGLELRARYAKISLRRTFIGAPSSLSGAAESFYWDGFERQPIVADQEQLTAWTAEEAEHTVDHRGARLELWVPRLASVQETDVSQLTVTDMDLGWCRFVGAHQLDKLRLEGRTPFNRPPEGWQRGWAWPPVWRWSSRRVLAEEHSWRAGRRKSRGWAKEIPGGGVPAASSVGPERLTVLYRSLRKASEDAKNEAGAGDFYYGEMEARRHAATTGRGERVLLTLYWMISGYGQRAGRTLAVLALLVGVLFVLLTQLGLPASTAVQEITGPVPAAGAKQQIKVEVKPAAATLPPPGQRWTADRMAKAIRIALGSVVFRDSDQKLTPAGMWTVMTGRALGPLLLALAALAIRARVKR